jgi:hypothetical protein
LRRPISTVIPSSLRYEEAHERPNASRRLGLWVISEREVVARAVGDQRHQPMESIWNRD